MKGTGRAGLVREVWAAGGTRQGLELLVSVAEREGKGHFSLERQWHEVKGSPVTSRPYLMTEFRDHSPSLPRCRFNVHQSVKPGGKLQRKVIPVKI